MERIETANGLVLKVDARAAATGTEIVFEKTGGPDCWLHWGLLRVGGTPWCVPQPSTWPERSVSTGGAVATAWVERGGRLCIHIRVNPTEHYRFLEFVVFDPSTSRWDNNRGRNYRIALPATQSVGPRPLQVARELAREGGAEKVPVVHEQVLGVDEGYELAVVVRSADRGTYIALATDVEAPLHLHWGMAGRNHRVWQLPPEIARPAATVPAGETAVETPFVDRDGVRCLSISFETGETPRGLCFVLHEPGKQRWWKIQGRDGYIPIHVDPVPEVLRAGGLAEIAEDIIEHETMDGSWSLMHRFQLAHELLGRLRTDTPDGLALLFVWLRYSAIRQLDWQRRYNTKPRELAHAQDRLTQELAARYAAAPTMRPWLRKIAGSVGRGGDGGQRVRDGILEIMHRHHIKEVAGHFLEEWHQKLHNNTTPDDVAICEAYLEFLRRFGDRDAFYATLAAAGVDRKRLTTYERPIRSDPDFVPSLRDALLRDFGEFLNVLRAVHAATDLATAVHAARPWLDEPSRRLVDALWSRRDDAGGVTWLLETATKLREALAQRLTPGGAGLRDLLYLDLALEDFLRNVVERNLQSPLDPDELALWMELALRNSYLSQPTDELAMGLRHWQRLVGLPRVGRDWALHAQAALERLRRELTTILDAEGRLLQPLAEHVGAAVEAADWSVRLFSEEVLRGGLAFVVSALIRKLDDKLRPIAGVGAWQVVSRGSGRAIGVVHAPASLASVQGQRFPVHTVLLADEIRGDEDIPEGVVAILGNSNVDLLSHVAVRARNDGVLMATCWDVGALSELRARSGTWVRLNVNSAGDVLAESGAATHAAEARSRSATSLATVPKPTALVLTSGAFRADNVGAKALNLRRLQGHLPGWVHLPSSVALPFGLYECVVDDPRNAVVASELRALTARLSDAEQTAVPDCLRHIREVIRRLDSPSELESALRTAMREAGLAAPEPWAEAWQQVLRVWASKWNERAYWSRRSHGIRDASLTMAVLIQEVMAADYAFVVHTTNPTTGDPDDLYAELVVGLGETLVGNHPGRALGFAVRRGEGEPRILSYPSKSLGLHGGGLIFRSDSNGEDLEGFAGAGLYDSYMLPPPEARRLDATKVELLWNEALRDELLRGVAEVGHAVEAALGGPQDIEGVYANARFYVVQARPQVGVEHG